MNTGAPRTPAIGALFFVLLIASGCASRPFEAPDLKSPAFLDRVVTQEDGNVRISATVPTAEEVIALTGLDLYDKDIQPVWLRVENNDSRQIRIALYSIDDEYYSPMEVAWYYRGGYSDEGRTAMERWFHDHQMPRIIPPGETRSGLVFTHRTEGTKGFNVDAYTSHESFNFTFFVPIPGFQPDYMDVKFAELYAPEDTRSVDLPTLRQLLADYACCSTDESGDGIGDPFNVVIVATPVALRRALLRSDWQETESGSDEGALARQHYFLGRVPDGTFHKTRPDGSEKKELRIWMSPIFVGDVPVWLAQASYEMSGLTLARLFNEYQIDPDVDDARAFVLQSFWYSQSLAKFAMVAGVPPAKLEAPNENFLGSKWFTDGGRIVMVVPEEPIAMDETEILYWERIRD
jgi:hypothetical protein